MNLPSDVMKAVIVAAGKELADRLEPQAKDLQLFTIAEVAERLRVSEPTARRLIREHVDLGEASKRVSLAQLRKIIESRTAEAPAA
ncbi:helix-turn-helix domain-containing protein [Luteolibacter yonseiensis]|uniref:Helix-turn-helix domain-containing protein n=1 Tax=Luteolibacter yonseiensis TaxID=1144680 RepID=A0A934R175_9BACT|nr:helix-turn-helix domain-containing protein [Luteolibacter yonseiensis]MBK1816498.1 helix-turn-helix domain-containing protein [Luteolibacter yonseiensis]